MTLFGAVSTDPEFAAAISKFYGGRPDQATLDLLGGQTLGHTIPLLLSGMSEFDFEQAQVPNWARDRPEAEPSTEVIRAGHWPGGGRLAADGDLAETQIEHE